MKPTESSQIGGKGTVRRKKKGTKGHIVPKVTNQEKEFNKILQGTNNLILEINEEYNEIWNIFMDEWWYDTIESYVKKDFPKIKWESILSLKKEQEYESFYTKFIKNDSGKILLNIDYKLYRNTFSEQGLDKMLCYIEDLEIILNKKEYLDYSNESESNTEDIKNYYTLLKLDPITIPTKSELKNAYYTQSRDFHPDKHPDESEKYTILFKNVNKAYKTLLNYYYYKKPLKETESKDEFREKAAMAAESRASKSNLTKSNVPELNLSTPGAWE